jgi:hypothetical protein
MSDLSDDAWLIKMHCTIAAGDDNSSQLNSLCQSSRYGMPFPASIKVQIMPLLWLGKTPIGAGALALSLYGVSYICM